MVMVMGGVIKLPHARTGEFSSFSPSDSARCWGGYISRICHARLPALLVGAVILGLCRPVAIPPCQESVRLLVFAIGFGGPRLFAS